MAQTDEMVPVADAADLSPEEPLVTRAGNHAIALFSHEGEVYAVDNRCPHMGFPLSEGSVEDGVLTCHWHHARFELEQGDTFDIWADDVQTYPVEVRDGRVYVHPDPEPDVPPATHWRNRLADGLQENLSLVMAKAVIGLDSVARSATERSSSAGPSPADSHAAEPRDGGEERSDAPRDEEDEGFTTPVETALNFGTKYRDMGWGRGLTTLGCTANLYDAVGGRDKRRAMFLGVREVADDCAGEPPRFGQYAFDSRTVSKERLKTWFRDNCEVRDTDGAERVLLTALANLPKEDVAEILFTAATDHRYMNASHTLDFVNKAFETLEHVGSEAWNAPGASGESSGTAGPADRANGGEAAVSRPGDPRVEHADAVLASVVPQITDASRAEETSSWRTPVDIAGLCSDAEDLLPDLVAAGEGKTWERPEVFVETLLSDDPEAILDALTDAIREGATQTELADTVARAATERVAYFATSNEFSDWDTAHHTLTYANAVHRATTKTDAVELYRACFDGAMSVYLDRFLNTPPAPVPDPGDGDGSRDPKDVREDLLACFDEQGEVDRAGRLVDEHFEAGGDPADLKRTLGRGLLREDADFHTIQNVEAGFQRFDAIAARDDPDERDRRLALIAPARYLAAHTPTRREAEQTFGIATRLHRGERLHEAE